MAKATVRAVKGTRDFYPEQMAFRSWLYGKVREMSSRFGYMEYEAPILETLELYAAKSGEELVKEQSYVFTDRGGDAIALRPELTPSLARMVAQRQRELPRPLRWWSFGPFWRYEQPQKGRTREFFQWNIDLIGTDSILADAEIITILAEFFRAVGLTAEHLVIKVNDRGLMEAQIRALGIGEEKIGGAYRLIDKRDKLSPADWAQYAQESAGLTDAQTAKLDVLLCNRDLWRQSPALVQLFALLQVAGVGAYVEYDPSIIRGLNYYTGTVFEAWDRSGRFRSILGGGRYNNLVADVGGEPLGGVGFGMGDVVIGLLLEQYGLQPELRSSPTYVLVTIFAPELAGVSARVATTLRAAGVSAELYPDAVKLGKQLKYADALAIPFAVIIGPDEAASDMLTLRDLATGEQQVVSQYDAASVILGHEIVEEIT